MSGQWRLWLLSAGRGLLAGLVVLYPLFTGAQAVGGLSPDSDNTEQSSQHSRHSTVVQDLRYGVALYHFYQQSYFGALTEIMVGQHKEEFSHHRQDAELLRGGMSLSYGLDNQAEPIFKQLLASSRTPAERDIAWFYLGKLQYQRGKHTLSQQTLSQLSGHLPPAFQAESQYLKANILLRQGEFAAAAQQAGTIAPDSVWLPYYWYNLGAMQLADGDNTNGLAAFEQIKSLPAATTEIKNLQDRAFTAAGFDSLAQQQYQQAIDYFKQVRLNSVVVHKALLGYGWAEVQRENYAAALSPWQQLSKKSLLDASVQESLLAIPYAYEQLNAAGSALHYYQQSVKKLETELTNLQRASQLYQDQPIANLFPLNKGFSEDWLVRDIALPMYASDDKQANTLYLAHLIAKTDFQIALKNYRDLDRVSARLKQVRQRLDTLKGINSDQQSAWQALVEQSQYQVYQQRYQALLEKQQRVADKIQQAVSESDAFRLGDEQGLALWQRSERARRTLTALYEQGEASSDDIARYQLLRGLLVWQNSEQLVPRVWQLKKQQQSLDKALQQTQARLQTVLAALSERREVDFDQRIVRIEARLNQQITAVDQLLMRSGESLRQLALAELESQQTRLLYYIAQARLAIARLYDIGSTERGQ